MEDRRRRDAWSGDDLATDEISAEILEMGHEQIQYLPIGKIDFLPQVRHSRNSERDAELAQSIRENGLLQPPRVRRSGDRYAMVLGERRTRALMSNGETTIPAIIEEKCELTAGEILQRQLVENMQRVNLTPIEKASGISRLLEETGLSASEAALKLGVSNATVSRLLPLLDLPESIQKQVADGTIAASAAYKLSRVRDVQQQSELAGEVAAGRLTRDELDGVIRPKRRVGARAPQRQSERLRATLGGGRTVSISGPGLNVESFVAWLEELLSRARDVAAQASDLPSLAKLLKNSEVAG